jgi:uncharacterized membrane protein HdeD (DUF308 family)
MKEKYESRTLGTSLLTLLFGLLLLFAPVTVAKTAVQIAGIACILFGAFNLLDAYRAGEKGLGMVIGIIAILIGLMVVSNASRILNMIPLCLGIYLVINAIMKMTVFPLSAIPDMIFGIILLCSGFGLFSFAMKVIGIIIIIIAILDLAGIHAYRKR